MTPAPLTVRSLAGFTDGVGSKVTLGAHATGHPSRVLVTPAVSWSPCRPAISEGARAAGQAELVAQRAAPGLRPARPARCPGASTGATGAVRRSLRRAAQRRARGRRCQRQALRSGLGRTRVGRAWVGRAWLAAAEAGGPRWLRAVRATAVRRAVRSDRSILCRCRVSQFRCRPRSDCPVLFSQACGLLPPRCRPASPRKCARRTVREQHPHLPGEVVKTIAKQVRRRRGDGQAAGQAKGHLWGSG